jgi:hypothetical protein
MQELIKIKHINFNIIKILVQDIIFLINLMLILKLQ